VQPDHFHETEIAGIRFVGMMSVEGPKVSASKGRLPRNAIALGHGAVIDFLPQTDTRDACWCIRKSGGRPVVLLDGFGEEAAERLSAEFGISRAGQVPRSFFDSPAYDGLKEWLGSREGLHARFRDTGAGDMAGWHERALKDIAACAPAP
jgi:hypothetical protein